MISRLDQHFDEIVKLYNAGESDSAIGKRYGVHGSSVRNLRLHRGVKSRTTWSRDPVSKGLLGYTGEQNAELKAAYNAGATLEALSLQHNVALVTVRKRLMELGVVMRPVGPDRVEVQGEMIRCGKCQALKPRNDFTAHPTNGTGCFSHCKVCEVDRYRQRMYGVTTAEYETMLAGQHGVCAICAAPPDSERNLHHQSLAIDHCHKTGVVRKLVCHKCNLALGHFGDNPEWMATAIEYVKPA